MARYGPSLLRRALLVFLGTFSVSYALYDIKDDLLHLASRGASDAEALARVTYIPALVWGLGWGILSLAVVALTLRRILASGPPVETVSPTNAEATGPTQW